MFKQISTHTTGNKINRERYPIIIDRRGYPPSSIKSNSRWVCQQPVSCLPKGGGQTPVIDLMNSNHFVKYEHFKMENIHMLRDLLKKRRLTDQNKFEIDLFHILYLINHRKFLRFLWKENLHEFACLPFGLASAPRVFTKILKPVIKFTTVSD